MVTEAKTTLLAFFVMMLTFPAHSGGEPVTIGVLGRLGDNVTTGNQYGSGFYAARDTYGMRANSVVAAFQANPGRPFDFPIAGFPFVKALGSYPDRDSVSLYADNSSPAFKAWEVIKSADYTPTSFTAPAVDGKKITPGMIIDTDHNPKWSSYVVAVQGDRVITAGWVNSGTKRLGTPESGIGLVINPITKIWATNFNAFLPKDGRSSSLVIQENAIVNNKIEKPSAINGLDTVILPQSKFGGTAAYLARSADGGNAQQWHYGFISQGSVASFTSSDSKKHSPSVGFLEDSKAKSGMIFNGRNTDNSIVWKDSGRVAAAIDPTGLITKFGYKTAVAKHDTQLSDMIGRYLINPNAKDVITLTLPKKENVFAGYTIKLMKVSPSDSTVVFKSPDSQVNGGSSAKIPGGAWNKEAVFDGTYWYIY